MVGSFAVAFLCKTHFMHDKAEKLAAFVISPASFDIYDKDLIQGSQLFLSSCKCLIVRRALTSLKLPTSWSNLFSSKSSKFILNLRSHFVVYSYSEMAASVHAARQWRTGKTSNRQFVLGRYLQFLNKHKWDIFPARYRTFFPHLQIQFYQKTIIPNLQFLALMPFQVMMLLP